MAAFGAPTMKKFGSLDISEMLYQDRATQRFEGAEHFVTAPLRSRLTTATLIASGEGEGTGARSCPYFLFSFRAHREICSTSASDSFASGCISK